MSWNNVTPAWVIEQMIYVSDCCKAELIRRMGSPSGWECSRCKLTCGTVKRTEI